MTKKIKNAIISDLSWTRDSDGHWKFSQYCDHILRIWNRKVDGFVYIISTNQICVYCIKGQEDKWKIKVLDIVIKDKVDQLKDITKQLNEITALKFSLIYSDL